MKILSAIVPCFNEEENIVDFYEEFCKNKDFFASRDTDYEIIFVDDGSKDKTLAILKENAEKNKRVNYLSFSRNFGKEAGMYAGLQHSSRAPPPSPPYSSSSLSSFKRDLFFLFISSIIASKIACLFL